MNRKTIEKANELIRSQKYLNDLRQLITFPYPKMFSKKKDDQITGFCYEAEYLSFVNFDDVTRERLKSAILSVVDERYSEIEDEIKKL